MSKPRKIGPSKSRTPVPATKSSKKVFRGFLLDAPAETFTTKRHRNTTVEKTVISRPDSGPQKYSKRCVGYQFSSCLGPREKVFFRVSVRLGKKVCFFNPETNRF